MIQNYFKIAFRNLWKNKTYSAINVFGLAIGIAVTMLIGMWVIDELSFNKSFQNYDKIGQAYMHQTFNGHTGSQQAMPAPLGKELREKYSDFDAVSMASWNFEHTLSYKENRFIKLGMYVEPAFLKIFSVRTIQGSPTALEDVNAIMLSKKMASHLFGEENPINKIIKLDNQSHLKVTAVFEDFPASSVFDDVSMLATWEYYKNREQWVKESENNWNNNSFQCFVTLNDKFNFNSVNAKIKNLVLDKRDEGGKLPKPVFFLHPMSDWHLYSEFKEGVNVGGRIRYVWLFSIIGFFVLLLACINFMNLSTARSEKRAKEVGVRKAIGSVRSQLVSQFLSESFLTVIGAFVIALGLSWLVLGWFNELANKQIAIPFDNLYFWLISLLFIVITSLLAGSYPALYLSSFEPIRVLKGTFKVGKFTSVPRKILVVLQFAVSVTLIIGTLIVYQQIQFGKNRPVGYNRNGLIYVQMNTPDLNGKYEVLKTDLLATGVVENTSQSSSPLSNVWSNSVGFRWDGKDASTDPLFSTIFCTSDYGKTAGMKIVKGRDFSKDFSTDSTAVVISQEAAKIIGEDAVGKYLIWTDNNKKKYQIIGIAEDMMMSSPYMPNMPALFFMTNDINSVFNIRIKSTASLSEAIAKIEQVFKKHNPGSPFEYKFLEEEYKQKFASEERIGKLASVFAILAVFISCLGLFGLASFTAEQRTKEIGIRKVLGASVLNLWQMLSKDFIGLVLIACLIAIPIGYYYLNDWLSSYYYHTEINWWIFAIAVLGAILVTLLTVSYQAIKAALTNPVKSLKTE